MATMLIIRSPFFISICKGGIFLHLIRSTFAAIFVCVAMLPLNILANPQDPPTDLYANITHKPNGTSSIIPDVLIGWTRPSIAADMDGDTSGSDPAIDVAGSHDLSSYSLDIQDEMSFFPAIDDITIGENTTEQDISTFLFNGAFYEIDLYARHIHTIFDPQTDENNDVIIESVPATLKFITNFDTKVTGTDEGLELIFEHIPSISYQIGITQGAADNIGDFPEEGYITIKDTDLTADNIFKDPSDGRSYVKYLISEGISPGQMYSVYVLPTFSDGNPLKEQTTISVDPKVVSAITSIPLKVFNVGNGKIRLEWNISASILENSYSLTKTSVFAQVAGQNSQEIFTFSDNNGALIGYYELYEPVTTTTYWLEFEFTDLATSNVLSPPPISGKVEYIPYDAVEKPASPQIPKPYHAGLDLNAQTVREYLVKNDTTPYNSTDLAQQTFTVIDTAPLTIQLVWDAYTTKSVEAFETFDYDLVYDIWVTERKESLDSTLLVNGLAPIERNIRIDPDDNATLVSTPFGDTVGFKKYLTSYYDVSETLRPLATNKTYYIQIVAKRPNGATYATSEPTIVAITIDKNGDIFVPPILGKPPIKLKDNSLTTSSAAVLWREDWHEIIYRGSAANEDFYADYPENIELASQWHPSVFLSESHPKVFFKQPNDVSTIGIDLITSANLDQVSDYVGNNFFASNFMSRPVSLGNNIKYEIKTLPYEQVKDMHAGMPLEEWIYLMATEGGDPDWNAGWEEPAIGVDRDEYGLIWNEHKVEDLLANTAYITFVRAYRVLDDGTKLIQSYPSFIIYNTLANFTSEEEIPVVPNLNLSDVTDSSIEVFFKYNHKFDYEMVYSRLDDPDAADAISYPVDVSSDPNSEFFVGDGENAYIEIVGLFPETEYYVWIRAKQKEGDIASAWSSPVFAKTLPIAAPDVPISLGPASKLSLIELGLEYEPVTDTSITVQWEKDENDFGEMTSGSMIKTYAYAVEFANNIEFIDAIELTVTEENKADGGSEDDPFEILAKNIVKFNNLKANQDYFVKVKAIVTVEDTETDRIISKESEYSNWVIIVTQTSKDEYTGEPDNVVEFDTDFEENFNNNTGIWDYEIVNPEGVITQILDKNIGTFEVDLMLYDDYINAYSRRLTIPIEILQALANRGMTLKVNTLLAAYEIDPRSINLSNSRSTDKAMFSFTPLGNYDLGNARLDYPYLFQVAEHSSINMISSSRITNPVYTLYPAMEVGFRINEYAPVDLIAQVYDTASGRWDQLPSTKSNTADGMFISFDTNTVGINALYTIQNIGLSRDMTHSMQDIATRYGISQIGTKYFGNTAVGGTQFANLMLGIAMGDLVINLDAPISTTQANQVSNSGLFIGNLSEAATNESALAGLIKLYELRNGYPVGATSTYFADVSPQYQASIAKASALGLIDATSFRAQDVATYDYVCDILLALGL